MKSVDHFAMIDPVAIVKSMRQATADWHSAAPENLSSGTAAGLALLLHKANFDLWHEEDRARDTTASDATIASIKRSIDRINQHRNDTVEALDTHLLQLAGQQNPSAPLHSETPGLILDRLSILQLKLFHTAEELARVGVPPDHLQRNQERMAILERQSEDLTSCLVQLWSEVLSGARRFKIYRQLKMYNDPDLNPVLYRNPPQVTVR